MSYFDANATTPLSPAAREAWFEANENAWQNPSSPYRTGARVHNLLENARERLADLLDSEPERILFNSGATEGVNSVFRYIASKKDLKNLPVLLSPFEHSCVFETSKHLFGDSVVEMESNGGRCDPSEFENRLQKQKFGLAAIMAANNESGVIQPWNEIAELARKTGTFYLCDAAQWIGKRPLKDLAKAGFVTAAAHKFGGPKGCGFLIVPKSADDFRSLLGGEQENRMRAGTENYPSIAAMIAALEECGERLRDHSSVEKRLEWRSRFEKTISTRIPETRIAGSESERLWNTVFLIFPKGSNDRWVRRLDRAGFQISTGSACSTGKEKGSRVLNALGFSPEESKRAVRISSSWETEESDWQNLAEAIVKIEREIDGSSAGAEVIRL